MKKFILLILFISLSLPALASDWIIIDAETHIYKPNLKSYNIDSQPPIDIFYSYFSKDIKTASNANIYKKLEKDYKTEIAYTLRFIIINATQKKYANKSAALFDKNNNLIDETIFDNEKLVWREYTPDSKIAKILEAIIKELNKQYCK